MVEGNKAQAQWGVFLALAMTCLSVLDLRKTRQHALHCFMMFHVCVAFVQLRKEFTYVAGNSGRPWEHFTGRWQAGKWKGKWKRWKWWKWVFTWANDLVVWWYVKLSLWAPSQAINPILVEMLAGCDKTRLSQNGKYRHVMTLHVFEVRPLRIVDLGSCNGFFALKAAYRQAWHGVLKSTDQETALKPILAVQTLSVHAPGTQRLMLWPLKASNRYNFAWSNCQNHFCLLWVVCQKYLQDLDSCILVPIATEKWWISQIIMRHGASGSVGIGNGTAGLQGTVRQILRTEASRLQSWL